MALARDAMKSLEAWHANPKRTALLLDGARQVGKTFTVREFAARRYRSFLEVNFVETPSAMAAFEGDLDADSIIANLTAYSRTPLVAGETLVFFDEIQECPRARTAIKFLVDDGRFDYMESGSLLGVLTKEVPSYPVGYEERVLMRPLSLREFFIALGVQPETLDVVREAVELQQPVPPAVHDRLIRLFRLYLVVGGMPAAVQRFVDTSDVAQAIEQQLSIVALYRQDIAKYARNKSHVRAIYDSIPSELDKKNKRFKLSSLRKSARMERYEDDFLWIVEAGCALPCYNVDAPVRPLALNEKHSVFKLYANDVGLLVSAAEEPIQHELLTGDVGINWGSVLENAVAQELAAKGYALRYYDKQKIGEVDFLVSQNGVVVPIEVKSGKDYRRHRALDNLMNVDEWGLERSVVLCCGNVEVDGRCLYLPWYALCALEGARGTESLIIDLDV